MQPREMERGKEESQLDSRARFWPEKQGKWARKRGLEMGGTGAALGLGSS